MLILQFGIGMFRIILLLCLILKSSTCYTQSHEFRIGIQKGANKILIGDGFKETKIGHSSALKIEFVLRGKSSGFSFEPSVSVGKSFYYSRIEDNVTVKNTQRGIGLVLATGIKMNDRLTLKAGLFGQFAVSHSIDIISKNGTVTASFGSSDLYETYAPQEFQAGIIAMLEIGLGEKRRFGFEIGIQQYATSFLEKDYLLNFSTTASGSTVVFTSKSKPTVLLVGLTFRIKD